MIEPPQGRTSDGSAPLFLLADSQLLFRPDVAARIAAHAGADAPRVAYLGASNGDRPEFYALFLAAMEPLGAGGRRMVPEEPADDERAFLEAAEVIVLAGGSVERGWRAFEASGVREMVARRREEGAVLVGVSAGAVQLGEAGWPEGRSDAPFGTWGFAPFVVDAHDEAGGWAALREAVRSLGEGACGIALPTGGGAVLHPDGTLEALRRALVELRVEDGGVASALILPPSPGEAV